MSTLAAKSFDALTRSLFSLASCGLSIEEINEALANNILLKCTELGVRLEHRPWEAST
jgi:hypothetical protein